jgi:hypothetical protein
MDRATLLDSVTTQRTTFEATLAAITGEAWNEPVNDAWTRKDVLAHIEAWERRAVDLHRLLAAGESPDEIGPGETTDEFNARTFLENRDRPLDDVRRGEAEAYAALLALAGSMLEADLFDATRFPWLQGDAFSGVVTTNSIEHWADHQDHLTTG